MNRYKYNLGQELTSDAEGVGVDRGFLAHIDFGSPAAQSISAILGATGLTTETQTITEGITDPDVPRNLKIKANAADVTGDVVINGTDIGDNAITETIALSGDTEVQGDKAFKSITSIELPVETNTGTDEVQVGTANKLGIPYKLDLNTVLVAFRDGVKESAAPTVATDSANLANNTVLLDSALNGTAVDAHVIV